MTFPDSVPLDPAELAARLRGAAPGELVVLTPNRRLAQSLESGYDAARAAEGLESWPAADILPIEDWVRRLHEESTLDDGDAAPSLLSEDQEALGWEEIVAADPSAAVLVGTAALAREARKAWALARDWDLEGALGAWEDSIDAQAFARWAAAWQRRLDREGWIDAAGLVSRAVRLIDANRALRPKTLVLHAFDILVPAQRRLLQAARAAGIDVVPSSPVDAGGAVAKVALPSPREEIEIAALWARARLAAAPSTGPGRLGIVVPQLRERRGLIERIFARTLGDERLFDLSLGEPLTDRPLVDFALGWLEFASRPVELARVGRLLRSPFLGGAERELDARARLDAALRREGPPFLDLAALRDFLARTPQRRPLPACPDLDRRLEAVASLPRIPRTAVPHEWAQAFAARLAAAGFPGERSLDSGEFQTLEKWREALGRLGALGLVTARLDGRDALRQLRQVAAGTLFQPESGGAPVRILGVLESAGLPFDALWVSGLTDDAWPQAPRPHPLLPVSLQRRAGIPQSSADLSLALDRRITEGWSRAAGEVVFSWALADADRALAPSALVGGVRQVAPESLGAAAVPTKRLALFTAGREPQAWEFLRDDDAPAIDPAAVRGGTSILADQAACPFRAFAKHRLGAEPLESPEPGLDAADRGTLLHALMSRLWRDIGSHARLVAMPGEALAAIVDNAARIAVARVRADRPGRLDGPLADLERERLARVAFEWLAVDRDRPPFDVVHREDRVEMAAGPLTIAGRVDRVDRLASGALAVIDYKSGSPRVAGWIGDRPDDPQLPLYALAMGDAVAAVAFARLKAGEFGFSGLAREEGLIPGVPSVEGHRGVARVAGSWEELLAQWRASTDDLATRFARGESAVDPKRGLASCRHCELHPLCRVHERLGALAPDEGPGAPEDEE
ncbi:MAG: PD-(D/E)XK nuclease family protein [Betaproteobacteria bacterium]|nr:PD-(D/E)XK nuclease family protein [Betaproteobacteria bacterium]